MFHKPRFTKPTGQSPQLVHILVNTADVITGIYFCFVLRTTRRKPVRERHDHKKHSL